MKWFAQYQSRKLNDERRRRLQAKIDEAYEAAERDVKTGLPPEVAYQIADEATTLEQHQVTFYAQQADIHKARSYGLDIPADKYEDNVMDIPKNLSTAGHNWLKRELRKIKRESVEFWAKLILPTLSLAISILSLAISFQSSRVALINAINGLRQPTQPLSPPDSKPSAPPSSASPTKAEPASSPTTP